MKNILLLLCLSFLISCSSKQAEDIIDEYEQPIRKLSSLMRDSPAPCDTIPCVQLPPDTVSYFIQPEVFFEIGTPGWRWENDSTIYISSKIDTVINTVVKDTTIYETVFRDTTIYETIIKDTTIYETEIVYERYDTTHTVNVTSIHPAYVDKLNIRPLGWSTGYVLINADTTAYDFFMNESDSLEVSVSDTLKQYGRWRWIDFNISSGDVWGVGDNFMYAYSQTQGFSYTIASLKYFSSPDRRARTGIHIRAGFEVYDDFVFFAWQDNKVCMNYRDYENYDLEVRGAGCIQDIPFPAILEASYDGEVFRGWVNGNDGREPDFQLTINLGNTFYTGLAATSWSANYFSRIVYDQLTILDERNQPSEIRE